MPLISIIVPIYNAENTLRNCLDHLRAQTFTDFEVILVNDGSKDSSLEICEEYARLDGRFSVVSQANGGVSAARNTGIPLARGEYMTFADSDDYAQENWLADCIPFMDGVGLVVTGAHTTGFTEGHPDFLPEEKRVTTAAGLAALVKADMLGYTWHKFFRSELFMQHKLCFNQGYVPREDEELLLRYLPHIQEIQFVHSMQYVYDVPDFLHKYKPLKKELLVGLGQRIEEISGSPAIRQKYLFRTTRELIWGLRNSTVTLEEFKFHRKGIGLKKIWKAKASIGSKIFLSLPAAWTTRIFALEGKTIKKGY